MDEKRIRAAAQLRRAIEMLVQAAPLTEAESLSVAGLYEPWAPGKAYESGRIVRCGADGSGASLLWSVLQAHTSQEDWMPEVATSLFKRVGFDGGVPLWVQPLGGTDAYSKGDVVSHGGQLWESTIDANVWEPGAYGWATVP
jgi:hypothetical protein